MGPLEKATDFTGEVRLGVGLFRVILRLDGNSGDALWNGRPGFTAVAGRFLVLSRNWGNAELANWLVGNDQVGP